MKVEQWYQNIQKKTSTNYIDLAATVSEKTGHVFQHLQHGKETSFKFPQENSLKLSIIENF